MSGHRTSQMLPQSATACLFPGGMLREDVVDSYVRLVERRGNFYPGLPSVMAMEASFIREWERAGCEAVGDRMRETDVMGRQLLMFPVYVDGDGRKGHWALVVARTKSKTIRTYDAMRADCREQMEVVIQYLGWASEVRGRPFEEMEWARLRTPNGCPQSEERTASGVMVCAFAEHVARGRPTGELRIQEGAWRRRIAADLRRGRLNDETHFPDQLEVVEARSRVPTMRVSIDLSRIDVTGLRWPVASRENSGDAPEGACAMEIELGALSKVTELASVGPGSSCGSPALSITVGSELDEELGGPAKKREAAEGGSGTVEAQADEPGATAMEGDSRNSTRNKKRSRGRRRAKKYDVELRRGADGKRYRVRLEKKGP